MQYSQIATSMSPKFMQKIVQNADGVDPVSGLSGSKIAHHTASPITIIKQPQPCTTQLHSINPTTCMQPRFKFHSIGVAMMHTARATPAGARSTAAQHTRAEMQQLHPQLHCKQHRSNHNGCSLIATSMQLRMCHLSQLQHRSHCLGNNCNCDRNYRCKHCACICNHSASATATATATATILLRQHCNRNYNCSCYNHAITTIANTIATQVQTHANTYGHNANVCASQMPSEGARAPGYMHANACGCNSGCSLSCNRCILI